MHCSEFKEDSHSLSPRIPTMEGGEAAAIFTIKRLNESLIARGNKKLFVNDVANALVGTVLSHKDYNQGEPYCLDFEAVTQGYAVCLGGGKSLFKVCAVMKSDRFGCASARVTEGFRAAGFTVTFNPLPRVKKTKRIQDAAPESSPPLKRARSSNE
jgi:hypothetical protein